MGLGVGLGLSLSSDSEPVPEPVLTSLDYDLADVQGGDSITITGTGLGSASSCTVGGTSATITANTATSLTFTTPAKTAGTYDVEVTTPGGTDTLSSALEFWSPASITGISRWWDASRGVTTSGSNVTAWADQAAADSFAPQATYEPVYSATGFGTGKPGIVFTKGADFLEDSAGSIFYAAGLSGFVVAKTTDNTASPGYVNDMPNVFISDKGAGWNWAFGTYQDEIELSRFNTTTERFTSSGAGANDGDPHLFGFTHAAAGAIVVYQDNTSVASGTKTYATPFLSTIGCGYNYNDKMGGTLGAVVVTSGVISAGDRGKLYKWAKVRFGVT